LPQCHYTPFPSLGDRESYRAPPSSQYVRDTPPHKLAAISCTRNLQYKLPPNAPQPQFPVAMGMVPLAFAAPSPHTTDENAVYALAMSRSRLYPVHWSLISFLLENAMDASMARMVFNDSVASACPVTRKVSWKAGRGAVGSHVANLNRFVRLHGFAKQDPGKTFGVQGKQEFLLCGARPQRANLHWQSPRQQQDSLASADRAFLGGRPNARSHEARSAAAMVKQGLHVAS
jgi:hypothetical protein